MPASRTSIISALDKAIFVFIVLFLGSLTTSIFVNQLGYYGALVLLLARYFYSRENRFFRTGLEIPLLLFVIAEVVSTIYSVNQDQAFQNLLKRVLLLPIIYTISAAAFDKEKAKLYFNIYIVFAVASAVIYVANSYEYFVKGMFQVTGSGPGLFQYPITTSTLLSFTIIFLFAFFINEKKGAWYKLITGFFFIVAVVAIFATYKRTGWIGLAAGLGFVLILKKQYFYLLPAAILIIAMFFIQENISRVFIYEEQNGSYKQVSSFDTEGRPYEISEQEGELYLSDYENGLQTIIQGQAGKVLDTPEPVVSLTHWFEDIYAAYLVDTRFMILQKNGINFKQINEFASPGFTKDYKTANGRLYVLDADSGLTVFDNPFDTDAPDRFDYRKNYVRIAVDSNVIAIWSKDNFTDIYTNDNGNPGELIESYTPEAKIHEIEMLNGKLLLSVTGKVVAFDTKTLERTDYILPEDINTLISLKNVKGELWGVSGYGRVTHLGFGQNALNEISGVEAGFIPSSFYPKGDKLYIAQVKRNRLGSIFDPYLPSNFTRISLWKAGWEIFKEHPYIGVGDIDLARLYIQHKGPYDKEIQGHLHNNYIHLLAILGAFGFLVVMFLLGKIFLLDIKIFNELKGIPFASSYALGAAGCFVSFLTAGLTEWNFGDHEIITMVWFVTGLNLAFYKLYKKDKPAPLDE